MKLLNYIYEVSVMGKNSTNDLIKALENKDNKIKPILLEISKNYEKYEKETKKLLKKQKSTLKEPNLMASTMSKININKEILIDNSDANIADMLIKGLTMGNLELEKQLENSDDKKVINLAKELKKFGENYIQKLKSYL